MSPSSFALPLAATLMLGAAYGNDFSQPTVLKNCEAPKTKVADAILVFDSDACCTWIGGEMKINTGPGMSIDAVPTGTQMITFVRKVSGAHAENLKRSQIVLVEGRAYRWSKSPSADFDRNALKRGKYFCSMPATSTDDELKAALLK